jgi:hypothetical protein
VALELRGAQICVKNTPLKAIFEENVDSLSQKIIFLKKNIWNLL